jgi:hypothetical protein
MAARKGFQGIARLAPPALAATWLESLPSLDAIAPSALGSG